MPKYSQNAQKILIDGVVSEARKKVNKKNLAKVKAYIHHYYRSVSEIDLRDKSPADLSGAALAHLKFSENRKPNLPNVRIYNPERKKDGWESTHTIVEMVNDDMPFLVDSLGMVLNKHAISIHLTIHPIFEVRRDSRGKLKEVKAASENTDGARLESFQHIEIDRETNPKRIAQLENEIKSSMADVRASIRDWRDMIDRSSSICQDLASKPPPLELTEVSESKTFLEWMGDDNFTFLGYKEYRLRSYGKKVVFNPVKGSGVGILREDHNKFSDSEISLPENLPNRVHSKELLIITKANSFATVHRRVFLDYIGVKVFDKKGKLVGEKRFIGLFTSVAYNRSALEIPFIRHKVKQVRERSQLYPSSHAAKALLHILETFPRDDLFQGSLDELFDISTGILHLQERQRVKLFIRSDPFNRFFSCLVYIPRDRYNTQIRERVQAILMNELSGSSVEHTIQLSESILARVHIVVRTELHEKIKFDTAKIEEKIISTVRSWQDVLRESLIDKFGEEKGLSLFHKYSDSFSAAYQEDVSALEAASDIIHLEYLGEVEDNLRICLYHPVNDSESNLGLKLYRREGPIPLYDALPILRNMGLRVISERPYRVKSNEKSNLWIQDFVLIHRLSQALDIAAVNDHFEDAFAKIWRREMDNDGFNRLIIGAHLSSRQTTLIRAFSKYLLQIGVPFSQTYMEKVLTENASLTSLLVDLFELRFDPALESKKRDRRVRLSIQKIEAGLNAVESLDEDRILRSFFEIISASLRTNYFQKGKDHNFKSYISVKFDPKKILELPRPKPLFEIFVYSRRFEGVHLRGGKIARGGLRWSDRREDFRTEILGLMKAQMVKNTLIVPIGAKGGFVVKRPPISGSREALMGEVVDCYRNFIRGLLDITDNLKDAKVIKPKEVVRYDEDDPYLVVAADKGTATFSDIANSVAHEYNFWLGDAFASGGSVGYDHKAMGITARGAWESVKRLFRELDVDIQTTDFSVIGIGDMGGDVFGNGMLLSRHIQLKAVFNHLHIFLDPNPNSAKSYLEREWLFNLPRSTWEDYNKNLISRGGGVFSRQAKEIKLSEEVKKMLDIEASVLTPLELIRAIMRMRVDLFWNGGIGTYVKASGETHFEVGDRSNDNVRVNANELRCRIVGEGGNLGFTQLSRIEYALNGGLINTDFVDNSGGVDCSDREVNIKILLNVVKQKEDLPDKQRNQLLAKMTDEVATLVLRDNYLQSQAISMMEEHAVDRMNEHAYLIHVLENKGELDRALEFLPTDDEIIERRKSRKGLTRPELAILIAYGKITLYNELVDSDVPEDTYLAEEIERYFPGPLLKRYPQYMPLHNLRREIIAMRVTNSLVNRMGPTFAHRMWEESGADAASVARAYTVAREVFNMRFLWNSIESLDNKIPANVQYSMMFQTSRLLRRATRWLLDQPDRSANIASAVSNYRSEISTLIKILPELLVEDDLRSFKEMVQKYLEAGVPRETAKSISLLNSIYPALDITEIALNSKAKITHVASVYFNIGSTIALNWLRNQIELLEVDGHWPAVARGTLREDLYAMHRSLTAQVIALDGKSRAETSVNRWLQLHRDNIAHVEQTLNDMKSAGDRDFATLSVAVQEIRKLNQITMNSC